jgi:hypothetical protein
MIKLLKLDDLGDGTQRFQSQLMVGRATADFIIRSDGIMRCYGHGDNGMDFYEYKEPYQIVSDKADMRTQQL